jgi:hypothetical protein
MQNNIGTAAMGSADDMRERNGSGEAQGKCRAMFDAPGLIFVMIKWRGGQHAIATMDTNEGWS